MERTIGYVILAVVVVLVVRYWPVLEAAYFESRDDAARDSHAEHLSYQRARRELADRARGRVLEMRSLRSEITRDSDPNRAA